MKIKKIQGIIFCHLIIVGLTACSNAPSQNDEGNSEQDMKTTNIEQEAPVAEIIMIEPEIMRSEMWEEPPMGSNSSFEKLESAHAEVEPAASMPVEEAFDDAHIDIMDAPASAYAVQVYAGKALENVTHYMNSHGLDHMQIIKTDRDGEVFHVLVSIHGDKKSAYQTANDLEQRTGSKPWVRSVAGLKKIAVQ